MFQVFLQFQIWYMIFSSVKPAVCPPCMAASNFFFVLSLNCLFVYVNFFLRKLLTLKSFIDTTTFVLIYFRFMRTFIRFNGRLYLVLYWINSIIYLFLCYQFYAQIPYCSKSLSSDLISHIRGCGPWESDVLLGQKEQWCDQVVFSSRLLSPLLFFYHKRTSNMQKLL